MVKGKRLRYFALYLDLNPDELSLQSLLLLLIIRRELLQGCHQDRLFSLVLARS
jgi:hypothetical protein